MSTLHLENPANGFVRIEWGDHVVLVDPWTTPGIFDGSWHNFPPLRDSARLLAGATHVFVTHIHEDHFDLGTLARLDRRAAVLLPDQYPNGRMRTRLEAMGFGDVRMLPMGRPVAVAPGLEAEALDAMNVFGLELELYREAASRGSLTYQIDAGFTLTIGGRRLVLLADNSPYDPSRAGESLARMRGCDLLAFAYNGAASDYPLCYENLTPAERDRVTAEREQKRARLNDAFIELVAPRALLPYSSEFALAGPLAREFAAWASRGFWAEKCLAAERYQGATGIPAFGLYEGDVATLEGDAWRVARCGVPRPSLAEVAERLHSEIPNPRPLYPRIGAEDLQALVVAGAEHMFGAMDRFGLASEWCLALEPDDMQLAAGVVDLKRRVVSDALPPGAPALSCRCEASYLAALLRADTHWNNARISFNLRWSRVPNVYDHALFDLLNYFHAPRAS